MLAPEAGGVLPAELSEDLFSTEHRRLRRPKLDGEDSLFLCGLGSDLGLIGDSTEGSGCGSTVFDGESVSDDCKKYSVYSIIMNRWNNRLSRSDPLLNMMVPITQLLVFRIALPSSSAA